MTQDRIKALEDALRDMCEEFRGHDLPYGSKAYHKATAALAALAAIQPAQPVAVTVKPLVWPDFIAPQQYEDAAPGWEDPRLPDFRQIFSVARECGYSIGLHGSMRRDCDMIAAPWTDEASTADHLIDRLCSALNARIVGASNDKPHGRIAWNLQIDGYFKVIDISVLPTRAPVTVQDAARVVLISSDRGVCVGGRWDGWLMIRHHDGHWVSHQKLDAVDLRTEMTDALRTIAEGK